MNAVKNILISLCTLESKTYLDYQSSFLTCYFWPLKVKADFSDTKSDIRFPSFYWVWNRI